MRQSKDALELHQAGGCFSAFALFRTIFLLHLFITVVGQKDACGLENGRKGTEEQAATRAREGEMDGEKEGGRERRMKRTLHNTKCAMVVFHATSVWHMPHVVVRVV